MGEEKHSIQSVAVIGSGVMGSAIAAHIANAKIPVFLLDVPQKGFGKKNALAEEAIERMKKADPEPLMHVDRLQYLTPGNIEQMDQIADVDWVIEAIIEKKEIKQGLYEKLEQACKPTAILSSNTSTIPLGKLVEGRSKAFRKRFLITHFFNPPRYMRLLEIVAGTETDPAIVERITDFADWRLGKRIVNCHDTPGFIGNRIGAFWVQSALLAAIEDDLTVEEADALMSKPLGIPKTGIFGLMDLIGMDLIPLIGKSMRESLPPEDPYCKMFQEPEIVTKLIAEGYTGRKGKGGFYRLNKEGGKKIKEAVNLKTGVFAPAQKPRLMSLEVFKEGLQRFISYPDKGGQYVWKVMSETLCYAASLIPEIADTLVDIDTAMQLGYNWKWGPFELLDKIGPQWFAERLKQEGKAVPEILEKVGNGTFYRIEKGKLQYFTLKGKYEDLTRRPGVLLFSDLKKVSTPVEKNASAALWDIGERVLCLEFKSKMNTIDPNIFEMIFKAIEIIPGKYQGLVIHNDGSNFSVGANVGLALFALNLGLWETIKEFVGLGQKAYQSLKFAPFPVVAAPSGMALGGGCEILMHCDFVTAHAESYIGLVEVGVGVVPAWGGCKELLTRWLTHSQRPGGSMVAVGKVFEAIGTAKVAKSADQARDLLFLLPEASEVVMNRDRLLAAAKQKVLELAKDYKPPEEREVSLPGGVARVAMQMAVKALVKAGKATPYDEVVAKRLAEVLSGGNTDITDKVKESAILPLELDAFMELIKDPRTWARVEHILETGKPLRN